ncbi:MAG: hypothetical protein LBQ52_04540 [Helicobacteraceae bacterium]|jgi:hypothetical protein|nr:hypothetical protein [Helicobacteraceae bacterium]
MTKLNAKTALERLVKAQAEVEKLERESANVTIRKINQSIFAEWRLLKDGTMGLWISQEGEGWLRLNDDEAAALAQFISLGVEIKTPENNEKGVIEK